MDTSREHADGPGSERRTEALAGNTRGGEFSIDAHIRLIVLARSIYDSRGRGAVYILSWRIGGSQQACLAVRSMLSSIAQTIR